MMYDIIIDFVTRKKEKPLENTFMFSEKKGSSFEQLNYKNELVTVHLMKTYRTVVMPQILQLLRGMLIKNMLSLLSYNYQTPARLAALC